MNTYKCARAFIPVPRTVRINQMHDSCMNGKLDMIKFLPPRFGAKVHDKVGNGWTILHLTAGKGHCDVARYVIKHLKLNPQDRDKVG